MVRNRRPVVLDLVTAGGEVVADAIGRLTPPLVREQAVDPGQRPVRLTGEVLRVVAGTGCPVASSYSASTAPDGSVWATMKRASPRIRSSASVSPVSNRRSTRPAVSRAARADGGAAVERDRGPSVAFDEVIARPLDAAVGALQRARDAGASPPGTDPSPHRRGARRCTASRVSILHGVVLVQPRAVVVLVAGEPVDRGGRTRLEIGGRHVRAVLGRGQHAEGEDGRDEQHDRRTARAPGSGAEAQPTLVMRAASRVAPRRLGRRQQQRRQGEPGGQRQPAEDEANGRRAVSTLPSRWTT